MRKAFLALFASIALMVLALLLLRVEGEHIYSGKDTFYRFVAGLALFLLSFALLIFTIACAYLSKKLSALNALLLGCLVLVTARVTSKIVLSETGMDKWTMALIVPPLIGGLSGIILTLVGAIRLLSNKNRRQPL